MIREIREKHNLSQSEMGNILGLTQQAIARIEKTGNLSVETAIKISEKFNVTLDDIFLNNNTTNNSNK